MNKHASKRGFTLIELLVVISIILIASSIIFIGGNSGAGAALSSSTRIVSGIAQGARGQAILKNAKTRLIIYSDTSGSRDDEKYLRFFGIVYEDTTTAAPDDWIAATQGTYLPEGIYFDPDLSEDHDWSKSATMKLEYPRSVAKAEGSGEDFYYYEFNSNGTVASGFENDWLVLRAGTLKPDDSGQLDIVVEPEQEAIVSALILRRSGTTTMVDEPDDILN
jgi:prepilin-type N-terminal cleavage/methylation domain-containing protein